MSTAINIEKLEAGYKVQFAGELLPTTFVDKQSHFYSLSVVLTNDEVEGLKKKLESPSESHREHLKNVRSLESNGELICYIKNPTVELQMIAVEQNPHAIQWIKNPAYAVQYRAVEKDAYSIAHIANASEELQLLAIKTWGYAIERIQVLNVPTKKVWEKAISKAPNTITFHPDPPMELTLGQLQC